MTDNKGNQSKASYSLRLVAGGYLIYLAYGLSQDIFAGKIIDNKVLIIAAMIIFTVAGILLVFTSVRFFWKDYKDKKNS